MTDKPNPVGLKKEISGHPTDHSRKALVRQFLKDGRAHNGFLRNEELGQYCARCNTAFVGNEMNFENCPNCGAPMACLVKGKSDV